MIRYFKRSDIDVKKWNRCVEQSRQRSVLFKAEYLYLLDSNWGALIENDYESLMPLPQRRKYALTYIYPPPFAFPTPIISLKAQHDYTRFLKVLPKYIILADLVLEEQAVYASEYGKREHQSFRLNLGLSYEQLQAQYAENTKRNLKKSKLQNVKIIQNSDLDSVIQLFKATRGGKKDVHYQEKDYQFLKKVGQKLIEDGFLESESLYFEGKLCGSVLWLKDGDCYYFLFSAAHVKYKAVFPLFRLIDHFIEQKAWQSIKIDFRGSNQANLARFYQSFGGVKYQYSQILFSPTTQVLTSFFKTYRKFK